MIQFKLVVPMVIGVGGIEIKGDEVILDYYHIDLTHVYRLNKFLIQIMIRAKLLHILNYDGAQLIIGS